MRKDSKPNNICAERAHSVTRDLNNKGHGDQTMLVYLTKDDQNSFVMKHPHSCCCVKFMRFIAVFSFNVGHDNHRFTLERSRRALRNVFSVSVLLYVSFILLC